MMGQRAAGRLDRSWCCSLWNVRQQRERGVRDSARLCSQGAVTIACAGWDAGRSEGAGVRGRARRGGCCELDGVGSGWTQARVREKPSGLCRGLRTPLVAPNGLWLWLRHEAGSAASVGASTAVIYRSRPCSRRDSRALYLDGRGGIDSGARNRHVNGQPYVAALLPS